MSHYSVVRYPMEWAVIDHSQPVRYGAGKIISWHATPEAAHRKINQLTKQEATA